MNEEGRKEWGVEVSVQYEQVERTRALIQVKYLESQVEYYIQQDIPSYFRGNNHT